MANLISGDTRTSIALRTGLFEVPRITLEVGACGTFCEWYLGHRAWRG